MPDAKEISALTTAEQTSGNDLFETSIPNSMTETGYISRKNSLTTIATYIVNSLQFTSQLQTTAKTIIGAINELFASAGKTELTGTLTAGATTVTFTDNSLTATCTLDVYVDDSFFGVMPTALSTDYANNSITFTFPEQQTNMGVKVRVT